MPTVTDEAWLVHRIQTVHGQARTGAEVFTDEATAWKWAETHPHLPNERRVVQRKDIYDTADIRPAGEPAEDVHPAELNPPDPTPWNQLDLFELEVA